MSKFKIEDIDLDDPRFRIRPYQQLLSSFTGAFITSIFVTPFDVVKIRMQAQQKALLSNKCFLYCNGLMDHLCSCTNNGTIAWMRANGKFNNTLDALIKISKKEGITSLWSGLSPTLTLAIPATVVYFVTYEQLRLLLKDRYNKVENVKDVKQPLWIPMLAGGAARVWAVTLVAPLELIRTKMQSQKLNYSEIGEALKIQIQQRGIRGLWLGIGSTLLRDVPFSAIYWMSYEYLKRKLYYGSQPRITADLIAGAIGGATAACLTLPFDVVKTHKQIEIGEKQIYTDNPTSTRSTWKILRKIYSQHGVKGLFTGITPRMVKTAPACAIMIATFEQGKRFFGMHNASQVLGLKDNVQFVNNQSQM